jgi:hypothetical protein
VDCGIDFTPRKVAPIGKKPGREEGVFVARLLAVKKFSLFALQIIVALVSSDKSKIC